ncbi:MAG TPA: DUF979 domain-containing protein [Rhizomicrobium sp.]
MITLEHIYILIGLFFAAVAALSVFDRANKKRFGNAAFWGLFAASFLVGSELSDFQNGVLVLALVIVGGFNFIGRTAPPTTTPEQRRERAARYGNGLFGIALIIPLVALIGTLFLKNSGLVDPKQVTLISLGLGVVVALAVAMLWFRPPLLAPLQEGRRLADTIGWAALLPQLLASLGAVFAAGGVGQEVGALATQYLPLGTPFAAVATYCIGMALFTIIMGNAFAAFPVMTAAIGLPLVVGKFHGDVTVMAAIGMLAGFCGTLTTPMAANFNIVPAALLEIPDYAVIRAQIPTAIPLLIANIVLMYILAFRF